MATKNEIDISAIGSSTGYNEEANDVLGSVPLQDRLGKLRPSRELLDYYRQRISEYDGEYERLLKQLEKYKHTFEKEHKNRWEVQQREDEIAELQKALSDMQVFLFQEREQVLRLYAENDRLKIKELEDRKRIQHLLMVTQPVNAETTYCFMESTTTAIVNQNSQKDMPVGGRGPGGHKLPKIMERDLDTADQETLLLTVEALKAQLEQQARLCKLQVDALLEDRQMRMEEFQAQTSRDTEKMKLLDEHLHKTQYLLYESTKDYLNLKYATKMREKENIAERDQLLTRLDQFKEQIDLNEYVDPVLGVGLSMESKENKDPAFSVKQLKLQLQQTQELTDHYREQSVAMEEQFARLREEAEFSKDLFKQRMEKLTKRLELMNTRYEALEKRSHLVVEGYKNDIKLLRQRLKEMEKQLFKLTLSLSGEKDTQILSEVKKTATRSKKLRGDLQHLKAKIYSLDNDVKHVHN